MNAAQRNGRFLVLAFSTCLVLLCRWYQGPRVVLYDARTNTYVVSAAWVQYPFAKWILAASWRTARWCSLAFLLLFAAFMASCATTLAHSVCMRFAVASSTDVCACSLLLFVPFLAITHSLLVIFFYTCTYVSLRVARSVMHRTRVILLLYRVFQ